MFSWFKRKWKKQQLSGFNPRPSCLKTIEDKPCIEDIYVCRHKSKDAYECLKKHGYNVKVVSGPADGWEKEFHVWIELEYKGRTYWYDPTWYKFDPGKYGCRRAPWSDRRIVKYEIHGVIKPTDDTSLQIEVKQITNLVQESLK